MTSSNDVATADLGLSDPIPRPDTATATTPPAALHSDTAVIANAPALGSEPEPKPNPDQDSKQDPSAPRSESLSASSNPLGLRQTQNVDQDISMPSPPTVSPLSTPAVTHINNDENIAEDDIPNMATELPPVANPAYALQEAAVIGSNMTSLPSMHGHLDFMPPDAPSKHTSPSRVQAIATTDPDPSASDFALQNGSSRQPQGSIDPNAYMMNLAAQATLFQPQGPSIVAPSDVSLHSFTQDSDALTGSADPNSASASASQKLESFAKIEFADSVFQMTTYAVIIGRDQRAMNQARVDERREAQYKRRAEENLKMGLPPPTPLNHDRGKFSKSYVSEEGGMLGPECSDGEEEVAHPKKRRSSSANLSANGDGARGDRVLSSRQYVSHTQGAAAVDLGTLQTSTSHIPFVGIHSPGPDIASKTRGISRQHLKIQFDKERGVFLGIALHKNGFFCDDDHYGLEDPVVLRSGANVQIKDVGFRFIINGVQTGKSGGEEQEEIASSRRLSVGGKEMSLDFEHSDHEKFKDTSESLSEVENIPTPVIGSDDGAVDDNEVAVQSDHADDQMEKVVPSTEIPAEAQTELPGLSMPEIPRRRGPGRPPKDGIMSKRERRLLKKQLAENMKNAPSQLQPDPQSLEGLQALQSLQSQPVPPGEKIKRPVGRPRKNPLPEDGENREKRKYNKRKSKEDGEEGSDAERRAKEKKDKKVRPKSPPLALNMSDFTKEQLVKPTKNYGLLIDEALTNGPPDGLTLKQIYKRIMEKYPWFFFYSETRGWESSVRHNLIGNIAFKKDESTGLWSRVPGVELDAGKKRKASSPDRPMMHPHLSQNPGYYQNSYLPHNNVNFAHGVPSSTSDSASQLTFPQTAGQQPSQSHGTPSQPAAQQVYSAQSAQAPAPAQLPAGYSASSLLNPPNPAQQSTYSSPYARPPVSSNSAVKPEGNAQSLLALPPAPVSLPMTQNSTHTAQQTPVSGAITSARPQFSAEVEKGIADFRESMTKLLTPQTTQAAMLVDLGIQRARGIPTQRLADQTLDKVADTLANGARKAINDIQANQKPKASTVTPTPDPATPNDLQKQIQRSVKLFRDEMVAKLQKQTEDAPKIVDSAVNRAQGLPHTGTYAKWETADDLIFKTVQGLIKRTRETWESAQQKLARERLSATATPHPPSQPIQSSQTAHQQAPSASPASAQPAQGVQPTQSSPVASVAVTQPASALQRPPTSFNSSTGLSLQRPALGITRPGTSNIGRPPMARSNSVTTPTAPSVATPSAPAQGTTYPASSTTGNTGAAGNTASSTPAMKPPTPVHNVSSPAPPSAGVVDQIMGQKRNFGDVHNQSHAPNPSLGRAGATGSSERSLPQAHSVSPRPLGGGGNGQSNTGGNVNGTMSAAQTSSRTVQSSSGPPHTTFGSAAQPVLDQKADTSMPPIHNLHASKITTPVSGEPFRKAPTPLSNAAGPSPPSAGVLDQIVGQKRTLDERRDNSTMELPEAKRAAFSPSAGVVDQIIGQNRPPQERSISGVTQQSGNQAVAAAHAAGATKQPAGQNHDSSAKQGSGSDTSNPQQSDDKPAAASPVAGASSQVVGQKRPLDEEIRRSSTEQPEPKRVAVSPGTNIAEQAAGHDQPVSSGTEPPEVKKFTVSPI
ncbi:hypothetical protein F5Y15DRAFT_392565 [Xylariaceae sp. FL0016]|nr:hypothetical protein F5Y15DRAFT_392565 [Xylariaceae sp. FL0016]